MHPIIVQQMAKHQIDTLEREAAARRRAALVDRGHARPIVLRQRLDRTAGRLRLILLSPAA